MLNFDLKWALLVLSFFGSMEAYAVLPPQDPAGKLLEARFMDCVMVLRGVSEGEPWNGEADLVVIPPSGKTVKISKMLKDEVPKEGGHYQVIYTDGQYWYPPAFVSLRQSARTGGRPGYSYRLVTYNVFDPRAIQESFAVLEDAHQQKTEDVKMLIAPGDQEQMKSDIDLGAAMMTLIPERALDKFLLEKMPIYGRLSALDSANWALIRAKSFSRVIEKPREIKLSEWIEAGAVSEEHLRLIKSAVDRFRSLHSTPEIRRGVFGEFSESWFVTKGEVDRGKSSIKAEAVIHVIRVGPMAYVYIFSVETSSPLSELAQSIRQSPR